MAYNDTTTLTFNLLTAMKMSPTALAWPSLTITSTNTGSTNDPITLNNTGNDDITNIQVTAIDLAGETTSTEFIFAGNFTVNTADASDNEVLVISGGGSPTASRGSWIATYGNEYSAFSLGGSILLQTGDGS